MMDESIRSFIAIELPKEIQNQLFEIQKDLRTSGADVKWVEPENIHLTLKFLGNITQEQMTNICSALDSISAGKVPFETNLANIGAFPRLDYARVIWIGINQNADVLSEISRLIEEKLFKLGFAKEDRPFSPHITIGRVRSPKGKVKLKQQIENLNKSNLVKLETKLKISKITLFQSTLSPKGPVYTKLYETNFTAS